MGCDENQLWESFGYEYREPRFHKIKRHIEDRMIAVIPYLLLTALIGLFVVAILIFRNY